ncbi:MAG: DUF1573 domain-containing protein [Lewinellaceae bacterium]|nr:DUF1573 domain-containing protein [Saprospiraceae bacterium]MCB9330360.1 DUF1573 domain-containing protein [Lewinellaceae bacterium]
MKVLQLVLLTICFQGILACHASKDVTASATSPQPEVSPKPGFVSWDKKHIDLGTVKRGEKRNMAFEFTNTSDEQVQIDIVDACYCTTVDFPRGVIEKGGKGKLDVVFDSTEKEKSETISINVIFKNTHEGGVPRIETVEYSYSLEN